MGKNKQCSPDGTFAECLLHFDPPLFAVHIKEMVLSCWMLYFCFVTGSLYSDAPFNGCCKKLVGKNKAVFLGNGVVLQLSATKGQTGRLLLNLYSSFFPLKVADRLCRGVLGGAWGKMAPGWDVIIPKGILCWAEASWQVSAAAWVWNVPSELLMEAVWWKECAVILHGPAYNQWPN